MIATQHKHWELQGLLALLFNGTNRLTSQTARKKNKRSNKNYRRELDYGYTYQIARSIAVYAIIAYIILKIIPGVSNKQKYIFCTCTES